MPSSDPPHGAWSTGVQLEGILQGTGLKVQPEAYYARVEEVQARMARSTFVMLPAAATEEDGGDSAAEA